MLAEPRTNKNLKCCCWVCTQKQQGCGDQKAAREVSWRSRSEAWSRPRALLRPRPWAPIAAYGFPLQLISDCSGRCCPPCIGVRHYWLKRGLALESLDPLPIYNMIEAVSGSLIWPQPFVLLSVQLLGPWSLLTWTGCSHEERNLSYLANTLFY